MKQLILLLTFLITSSMLKAQQLRKFGTYLGIYIPDRAITIGANYKIKDYLEIESEYSYYMINVSGLCSGVKYFYHFGDKTKFPINSVFAGVGYNVMKQKNINVYDELTGESSYLLKRNQYCVLSIGYRNYESFSANGVKTFFKEIYFQPTISFGVPLTEKPYYELLSGLENASFQDKLEKYSKGGINLLIRFGIVF